MLTLFEIVMPLVIIALISLPIVPVLQRKVSMKHAKYRMVVQISLFVAVFLSVVVFQIHGIVAKASEVTATAGEMGGFAGSVGQGLGFLGAALVTSCSAIGAGYAVAASAPAALGAISENPENFGKAMIFVALAEGVAIYGVLISILIINKL